MSGRSSPANGAYEAARLTVRKDLFPEVLHLRKQLLDTSDSDTSKEDIDVLPDGIKLETDFEKSIDDIANKKLQVANGSLPSPAHPRHRKHKQHSRRNPDRITVNGYISPERKRKKGSRHRTRSKSSAVLPVKSGKNLNLVSSSEYQDNEADEESEAIEEDKIIEEESESSEDEVLKFSVKLPLINVQRQSGKPYSHELSQLSSKKSKKDSTKDRQTYAIIPCSGKPRSMLDICSSRSKKKSKKSECTATYQSQIVDTNTIKIKIRRTSIHETITPTPTSIADIGQRKSKKKRAASPVASESSGEEYDPHRSDTAAAMSVGATKSRQTRPKIRKSNNTKNKDKFSKTERTRVSGTVNASGPQSPWGHTIPIEMLARIFEYVVASQGTLPSIIRLGRVCKLWHSASCRPELWKNVDLAQYTNEKCKTDYKLVWLLENRLSHCQSLNIAQWKVGNTPWVLACLVEYCPRLVELSLAGWSRVTPDQLHDLLQGLPHLRRLDLSLTSETGGSSTCLSAASMARVCCSFGERLTHLTLANNKFTALPQILSSVAAHCKNLEVLDISGALVTSHPAAVPLEALQRGCPNVRVFRAANSQLVLANATTSQQMESSGWSQLEELSIAVDSSSECVAVGEYRLGDEALARLVRAATRLRLLDLRGLQRLTDSGLVRVPAWDLQHLFLGGCNVIRQRNACLELICEKWSHSLLELDLSWATAARALDDAVAALADAPSSRLKTLNLCGSSVSLEPVKKVLLKCPHLESINLSSCRALPRGMKRLFSGKELQDFKDTLDPEKSKDKESSDAETGKKNKEAKNTDADSKCNVETSPTTNVDESSELKLPISSQGNSSASLFQEPKSISETGISINKQSPLNQTKTLQDSKNLDKLMNKVSTESATFISEGQRSTRDATPKLLSPITPSRPDSSSTPRSDSNKTDLGSPHYSPLPKPDSQVQNSPEVQLESVKSNSSWSLGQFKTTPTHKSEASPLSRLESHNKIKHGKIVEQCSPTTSVDNKTSPDTPGVKDIKNINWNYGNYSPMPRQESQFSSQRSPYSAQPSPAHPSPYSTQPSPYSTQPSPYSSQPSPYSAQPSPDTSQIIKSDLQKSAAWNTGGYSPMPKHHAPFSPHPSTHTSPDPGIGIKADAIRSNSNKTPGQYSPMSRQDRMHHSPYSPRPSVENAAYNNKKSPGLGSYSPMMRSDCHMPSPDVGSGSRPTVSGRSQDMFGRLVAKVPERVHSNVPPIDISTSWGMDRFNSMCGPSSASADSLGWGAGFGVEGGVARAEAPPPCWPAPPADELPDPWTMSHFQPEPAHNAHNAFLEPHFDTLNHQALQSFLDDAFSKTSRVD